MAAGQYRLTLLLPDGLRDRLNHQAHRLGMKPWAYAKYALEILLTVDESRSGWVVEAEPEQLPVPSSEDDQTPAAADVDAIVAGRLAEAEAAGLTAPRPQRKSERQQEFEDGGVIALAPGRAHATLNISQTSMRGAR
jgi:hypothetical protein